MRKRGYSINWKLHAHTFEAVEIEHAKAMQKKYLAQARVWMKKKDKIINRVISRVRRRKIK